VSIRELMSAIGRVKADKSVVRPGVWYKTQKEHWLGWLSQYHTPGAYGRIPDKNRDARYAYNHIVEPKMLLWLIIAAKLPARQIRAARAAVGKIGSLCWDSQAMQSLWNRLVKSMSKSALRSADAPGYHGSGDWHSLHDRQLAPRGRRTGTHPHHETHR
jgi:hypothetical protein